MFIEEDLLEKYNSKKPLYNKLGKILEVRINEILISNEIYYDYVQMRVKSFLSFFEKIDRNKYIDPFEENEDFCGLRIIHLFDDDLDKILYILREEFNVIKEINPTEYRPKTEKEFTYRSYHVFIKLKNGLLLSNIELKDLFAEIQIRTICMHTWAAIEHKLNYKQEHNFPKNFRPFINRKFSQMSAVLEIADDFFVSLRNEKNRIIEEYKTGLTIIKTKEKILDEKLSIEALQAYLENKFPKFDEDNRIEKNKKIKYLMNEMVITNLTLKSIEDGEKLLIQKGLFSKLLNDYPFNMPTQTGIARSILDITNDEFYKMRKAKLDNSKWMKFIDSLKIKLNKS